MRDSLRFEQYLGAALKGIAHVSDGHGESLGVGLPDGRTFHVWAFERPDNLQAIVIEKNGEILHDFRSMECKAESDRWVSQFPEMGDWVVVHSESEPVLHGYKAKNGFVCGRCGEGTVVGEVEPESRRAWHCAWCGARQKVPGLGMLERGEPEISPMHPSLAPSTG